MKIKGFATENGTKKYFQDSIKKNVPKSHFRKLNELFVSSVGIGTHLGDATNFIDLLYRRAISQVLKFGINVIDTSINYRFERSERCIGICLKELFKRGIISRDQVVISTKCGFLPSKKFIDENNDILLYGKEIVNGHCLNLELIRREFKRSLKNLKLKCIDIFYINGPEWQLKKINKEELYSKIKSIFEFFEEKIVENKMKMYGISSENFTSKFEEKRLDLQRIIKIAEEICGKKHHFKVIQFPFNLAMREALTLKNQNIDGKNLPVLEAAKILNLYTISNWPLLEGKILENSSEAIQFARSAPGIGTVLVGMKEKHHIEQNIKLIYKPPLTRHEFYKRYFLNYKV